MNKSSSLGGGGRSANPAVSSKVWKEGQQSALSSTTAGKETKRSGKASVREASEQEMLMNKEEKNPALRMFIDKLGERLAFERTGTRLYEALMLKCQAGSQSGQEMVVPMQDLQRFRNQEATHFKMIADTLELLGVDPTAQTPSGEVTSLTSSGIVQVLGDPRTSLTHGLNAMLIAELADNAGWELLIELAQGLGYKDMVAKFQLALEEEQIHLQTVQGWLKQMVLKPASISPAL